MSDMTPDTLPKLAYVIGTYPSLTTTFIDRELATLRKLGARAQAVSIRRPPRLLSAEQRRHGRDVIYLLPVSILPFLLGHLRFALLRPRAYFGTLLYLLAGHHPDLPSRGRTLLHFATGVYAAHLLAGREIDHVHAHFIDRAATVALIISRLRGVPYSVTAHAVDIYVSPALLPEKIAGAKFIATVSRYNVVQLDRASGGRSTDRLKCIYLGIDLENYEPGDGAGPGPITVLAVGRLTEKKGFTYLLRACQVLRERGRRFRCEIVGDGPLRDELAAESRGLSLADTVTFCGALPHPEVIEKYRRSHVFVLPCVVGEDGDRDGTPTVLLEAMAMRLPVVSTRLSGIPELVEDGVNGLLVPPGDVAALADALARLLDDREARLRLGERGRETVETSFDTERNVRRLLAEIAREDESSRRAATNREARRV